MDLADQTLKRIVGGVAHSPAHLKETGTAPRVHGKDAPRWNLQQANSEVRAGRFCKNEPVLHSE